MSSIPGAGVRYHVRAWARAELGVSVVSLRVREMFETLDVFIRGGAGGPYRQVGDFVWSNARLPYSQSGQWGYLRVLPTGDSRIHARFLEKL